MAHKEIVIVAAKRTAFGTLSGALKSVSANDLGVHAAKAALAQSGVRLDAIGHVIVGNVLQSSSAGALPKAKPSRPPRMTWGAWDMFSVPPARTTSASPS